MVPFLDVFFFNTAVPLQCRVLETGGECTGLVMRLDFTVPVHPSVCFSRRDGQNMCVFADTTDGWCRLGESDPCEVSLNRNIHVSLGLFFLPNLG